MKVLALLFLLAAPFAGAQTTPLFGSPYAQGSTGSVSGSCAGDLSGTYPNCTVKSTAAAITSITPASIGAATPAQVSAAQAAATTASDPAGAAATAQANAVASSIQKASKVINGVSYSNNYSGSTLDVRVNACIADAANLANGNTSGICDSSGEGATQTIASPIVVGTTSGSTATWRLPNTCTWTSTVTGSSNATIEQYTNTAIIGPSQNWMNCQFIASTNGTAGMYETMGPALNARYKAEGFTLYNGGSSVALGGTMVITSSQDTSEWKNIAVFNQATGAAALKIGTGSNNNVCCSANFVNLQLNSNNMGGPALDVEGNSTSEPVALNFFNSSFTHPASGLPVVKINDTAGFKASQVNFFGTYVETNNTDTTTAPIQITSFGQVGFWGLNVTDPFATSTATAITVGSSFPTSLTVQNMTQYAGFTQPATGIVNNASNETVSMDANGHLSGYRTAAFPYVVATRSQTGQTTAQTMCSYAVPAVGAGTYRIDLYLLPTAVSGTFATTGTWTSYGNYNVTGYGLTSQTASYPGSATITLQAQPSSTISVQSTIGTSATYSYWCAIERLQ